MALKVKEGINWVDLPKSLQPEVPAPGTVVEFRFTNGFKNYNQTGGSIDRFPFESVLPPIFQVQDGEKIRTVGLVGSYDNQGNPNAGEVRQLTFKPQENGGVVYLTPVAEDGTIDSDAMDTYVALSLHPQVADNDNKQTINPIMRKVDSVSEAKKSREARNQKREAQKMALDLKGASLERASFLLDLSGIKDEELLRDAIEAQADKNPAHFVQLLTDENGDTKAAFHKAIAAGELNIDPTDKKLKFKNGTAVMDLTSTDAKEAADEYAQYVGTDSGKTIHKKVTDLTAFAEKQAAKKA